MRGLIGVGLVLQNNDGDDFPVEGNGPFAFTTPVASGEGYAVRVKNQPQSPRQACSIAADSGVVGSGPISTVTVNCSTDQYTIGGGVTGLVGRGLTLKLNNGAPVPITTGGAFAFPTTLPDGQDHCRSSGTPGAFVEQAG